MNLRYMHPTMSLYHEAAEILDLASRNGGSVKSIVFGRKGWKNDPKALFALATEAAKWSAVLSTVIEKSGILKAEKHVCYIVRVYMEASTFVDISSSSHLSLPYYLLMTFFSRRRV